MVLKHIYNKKKIITDVAPNDTECEASSFRRSKKGENYNPKKYI